MNKRITILYFFVAAIYSLGFWGVEAYLQNTGFPESTIVIIACSHNLISTLICSYVFLKAYKKPTAIIWVIGFLIVGIADVFHGTLNWVYSVGPFNIINNLSAELYVIYSILLLIAIYKSCRPPNSKIETILCLSIATLYFATLMFKVGIPFYKTEFSLYFKVTDTLYNLFTTGIVTLLIISGLRTSTTVGLVFVSSYLLIFCSDLAIRYFDYIKTTPTLTIFNYGWELGFSLTAVTLGWIYLEKGKIATLFEKLPLNSLRFQIASLSFAVILIFMFVLRLLGIPYTFWQSADISVILTIFLITWTTVNSAALWLNKKLLSLKVMIIESESKNIPLQYEIGEIVDIYRGKNRLLQEANNTIEVQKNSIEMTSKQIAHDIRKPLASMKAILSMLPNIHNDSVTLNKMTSAIDRNIAQANDMLSEMLEFSKTDMSLTLNNHNPQSIVIAALGDALRGREDLDVYIEYDLKHANYLNVDGNRIIRVLTNIIGNAVEAMNGRGRIWFKTENIRFCPQSDGIEAEVHTSEMNQRCNYMRITIGNDGPVIPEDVRKKIFDPFFTKGKKGGTGLGLAICQKIVDMHGGKLQVSSNKLQHYRPVKLGRGRVVLS